MTDKSDKAYKTIGEVAKILRLKLNNKGVLSTHVIRFGRHNLNKLNQKYWILIEDTMMKKQ